MAGTECDLPAGSCVTMTYGSCPAAKGSVLHSRGVKATLYMQHSAAQR